MSDTDAHPLPGTTCDPLCPDSDGFPMGETDFHIAAIIWLREALEDFFADHPDVYVASNLLLYFRVGSLRERRDPDVLVAKGVGKHQRRSFRTWEENTVPCVVFEISSEKTWEVDLYEKRIDYRRLGIGEYFLFDPESRFLNPPLQGFRLAKRKYVPIPLAPDGSLTSQELGLRLLPEGGMLRLIDAQTGMRVLTRQEQTLEERRRADELAVEVKRLRKLLREQEKADGGEA